MSRFLYAAALSSSILLSPAHAQSPFTPAPLGEDILKKAGPIAESIEHVRVGKLRALPVTTAERVEVLADAPSVAEFVPDYDASGWHGVGVPASTPREIVEKLNGEVNALADPQIKARLIDLGGIVLRGSTAEFVKLIADETEKWAKVVTAMGDAAAPPPRRVMN